MNYLYHWVPEDMQGEMLYPLNTLKDIYPDLYKEEASKYVGREHIMQQRIPILDCLWNDVLHFSAVHPSEVKEALFAAGRTKPYNTKFFQIDPHLLDPKNTIVYLYKHMVMSDKLKEDNFAAYNPDDIAPYSTLPQVTKDYYKEMFAKGVRPLQYPGVPHILHRGNVDVRGVKIISV